MYNNLNLTYILQVEDEFKIGKSINPLQRYQQYAMIRPNIKIVKLIAGDCEAHLLQYFAKYLIRGNEWFSLPETWKEEIENSDFRNIAITDCLKNNIEITVDSKEVDHIGLIKQFKLEKYYYNPSALEAIENEGVISRIITEKEKIRESFCGIKNKTDSYTTVRMNNLFWFFKEAIGNMKMSKETLKEDLFILLLCDYGWKKQIIPFLDIDYEHYANELSSTASELKDLLNNKLKCSSIGEILIRKHGYEINVHWGFKENFSLQNGGIQFTRVFCYRGKF